MCYKEGMQIDGRTLSHETSETIRQLAVQRVKEGERPSSVIKSYGLCRTTIYKWLRATKRGGMKALKARKHPGRAPALRPRQKLQVRRWINGKDPRQYGFDFGLWTRQIVGALITQKFGVRLGVTAVGRLLAELDITPQKPLRRAYERDPVAIKQWTTEVFPRLRARAQRSGAKIFFLDEAGVRSDQVLGRTWGVRGQTPEVASARASAPSRRSMRAEHSGMKSTPSGSTPQSSSAYSPTSCAGARAKSCWVLDGHPAHTAKAVAHYVRSLRGRLELHFLPGYAPELNPDEFVWNYLKRQGVSKTPLHQGESLRSRVHADLAAIKSRPLLVRSFFHAPSVAYTSD